MDRRRLLAGGTAAGLALATELSSPESAEAAASRLQQGAVTVPGLANVDLVLNIAGRTVTGSLGGGFRALLEGTFVRNVLEARVFGVGDLNQEIGTLTGRTGRRGALDGTLTLNGAAGTFTTAQIAVSTAGTRRFAGRYAGHVGLNIGGEFVDAEHETTLDRRGNALVNIDLSKVAPAGGARGLGKMTAELPLAVFTTRGAASACSLRSDLKSLDAIRLQEDDVAEGIANLAILFARGGRPLGSVPSDFSLEFQNVLMSFALI